MHLENQVCSLELSKRLKELGVKQESIFGWMLHNYGDRKDWVCVRGANDLRTTEWNFEHQCSAFTVAEIGEMLPEHVDYYLHHHKENHEWIITFSEHAEIYRKYRKTFKDDNEANARAKMLIYLLENKLMEL